MTHAVFVDRQTLKFTGCRSQFIKNICTFKANIAIRSIYGSSPNIQLILPNMIPMQRMLAELRNRVEFGRG